MTAPIDFAVATTDYSTRAEMIRDLPGIAIGMVLLALGAAAAGVFCARRRARDRTLIYLSLYSILYATRLLARQPSIQLLVPLPASVWAHVDWIITCFVALPFGLFMRELVEGAVKRALTGILMAQAVFAVLGVVADLTGIGRGAAFVANNVLVIALLLGTFVVALWPQKRGASRAEMRILIVGFIVLGAFVVHANLVGLHLAPGRDLEPLGVLFFLACLGIVTAQRVFSNEQRLSSIRRELEIAQQIQASILPTTVPRLLGLDVAARYLPMSEVAGDFYDFLDPDASRLGVLIADVSGHGVPAALIASMLKVALSAQRAHASDPARVLAGINQVLLGKFERHFATAGYAFVDAPARFVVYAGAAQPPLLWWRKELGSVEEIAENGLPLGQFSEASYHAARLEVSPGDRLLFYTDGIPEAEGPDRELFGSERLRGFLAAHASLGTEAVADALLAELARWTARSGSEDRTDDVTLVVLDIR